MRCAVFGCNSNNKKKNSETKISFFNFPKNGNVCQQWVFLCRRSDKFAPKNSRICSKHFRDTDFVPKNKFLEEYGFSQPFRLMPNVVPTLDLPLGNEREPTFHQNRMIKKARKSAKPRIENTESVSSENNKNLTAWDDSNHKIEALPKPEVNFDNSIEENNYPEFPATVYIEETELKIEHVESDEESNYSSKEPSTMPSKHQNENVCSLCFAEENEKENDKDVENRIQTQIILKDAVQCVKSFLSDVKKRDKHAIYGEHIAHKIRTCKRSNTDICIAKQLIENICLNLTKGVYNQC